MSNPVSNYLWLLLWSSVITPHAVAQETPIRGETVSDVRLPTGRLVDPAGETLAFYGRPVDLELTSDGKYLLVKDWRSLRVVDYQSFELIQTIDSPGNASLYGIAESTNGDIGKRIEFDQNIGVERKPPTPRRLRGLMAVGCTRWGSSENQVWMNTSWTAPVWRES